MNDYYFKYILSRKIIIDYDSSSCVVIIFNYIINFFIYYCTIVFISNFINSINLNLLT